MLYKFLPMHTSHLFDIYFFSAVKLDIHNLRGFEQSIYFEAK